MYVIYTIYISFLRERARERERDRQREREREREREKRTVKDSLKYVLGE